LKKKHVLKITKNGKVQKDDRKWKRENTGETLGNSGNQWKTGKQEENRRKTPETVRTQ